MRFDDVRECTAHGHSPKQALRLALAASSFAVTATYDGEPHAMFGVAPLNAIEGAGSPWMLGSERIYHCARELIERGPAAIGLMHQRFARLENWVSESNVRAIRMLRHWGFEIGSEVTMFRDVAFLPFWKIG